MQLIDGCPHAQNDIALLKLARTLPSRFRPVALLSQSSPLTKGKQIVIAGFGPSDGSSELRLRQLPTSLYDSGKNFATVSDLSVVSTPFHGITHGDSGAPAAVEIGNETYVFGVTSYHCDYKFQHEMNVLYARDWLITAIKSFGEMLSY